MKIKIESDGATTTKIMNAETGEVVPGVRRVVWSHGAGSAPQATLECVLVGGEVQSTDAEIVTINPRKLRTLVITDELYLGIFTKGLHAYRVTDCELPPDARIVNARLRWELGAVEVLMHSNEWPEQDPAVLPEQITPRLRTVPILRWTKLSDSLPELGREILASGPGFDFTAGYLSLDGEEKYFLLEAFEGRTRLSDVSHWTYVDPPDDFEEVNPSATAQKETACNSEQK